MALVYIQHFEVDFEIFRQKLDINTDFFPWKYFRWFDCWNSSKKFFIGSETTYCVYLVILLFSSLVSYHINSLVSFDWRLKRSRLINIFSSVQPYFVWELPLVRLTWPKWNEYKNSYLINDSSCIVFLMNGWLWHMIGKFFHSLSSRQLHISLVYFDFIYEHYWWVTEARYLLTFSFSLHFFFDDKDHFFSSTLHAIVYPIMRQAKKCIHARTLSDIVEMYT